ncbi:MAG: hypothetical protein ACR2QT_08780 [Woeseiaceae bacterium]
MISRILLFSLSCLSLAACVQDAAPEFCADHVQFHAEHAASNAVMSVVMTEDGRVASEVQLPRDGFDESATMALLQDVSNAYTLQTESECASTSIDVQTQDNKIVGKYSAECGPDNKLAQVDVQLFESLPALNEVEVSVVTPATKKHFAINRQCASAIFRLE